MNPANRLSVLPNIQDGDLRLTPYPHLGDENGLDSEVFPRLAATRPADPLVVDGRPLQDTWFDYPTSEAAEGDRVPPEWREFSPYHKSVEFFASLWRPSRPL